MDTTGAIAHLKLAIANIDLAIREENYIRPSRQKTATPQSESFGSCEHCKRVKARCDGCGEPRRQTVCTRCSKNQLECTYPAQGKPGRKAGASKRSILLSDTRKALLAALAILDPSSASPASTASPQSIAGPSSAPFAHPTLPPMPSETSTPAAAMAMPLLPMLSAGRPPAHIALEAHKAEDVLNHDALDGIDNPLEVLAHVSLKERTTPATTEATVEEDAFAFAMREETQRISEADAYYSSGLYKAIDDTGDGELDPVNMMILTERDLRRLVNLYFTKLRRFFFHLDETLHTPDFLRNTSPFLTTSIAYIASTYDPESVHLVDALKSHVDLLAARVFSSGYKSVEIVQAFLMLQHWSPPAESWCLEEAWKYLGEALRIATEIRLDRPMEESRFDDYRAKTPMTGTMLHTLRETSMRTWHLLWSANLMMSVHSGRIVGKSLIGGLRDSLVKLPAGHPDYTLHCNELLNRILANALNLSARLQDKPLRDSFGIYNRSWRMEIEQWLRDWPAINHFIKIRYSNVRIMLLSLSLRFTPPSRPILSEVQTMAVAGLRHVTEWAQEDDGLVYASNSVITNIAYGATLLLKIISSSDPSQDPNLKTVVLDLCSRVVDTLMQIGKGRVTGSSHALLQAARMQSLIRKINHVPTPAAAMPQDMEQSWILPFTFPSPNNTGGLQAVDFTTDSLLEGLGGDYSSFFEDFSSSGLLSMLGDDHAMGWLPAPSDGNVTMQDFDLQVNDAVFPQ